MKRGGSYKAGEQEVSLVHGNSLMSSNKANCKARELSLVRAKLRRRAEENNSLGVFKAAMAN